MEKVKTIALVTAVGVFVGALTLIVLSMSCVGSEVASPGYFGFKSRKEDLDYDESDDLDYGDE